MIAPLGSIALAQSPSGVEIAGEEIRLSNKKFRDGLRKRGLTEILSLHLREFPPESTLESLLAMRDVRRSEFADPALSIQQRRISLREANDILEQLLQEYPGHPKRFNWRYELAHSLLYDEADPLVTSMLYYGGRVTKGKALQTLTTRALIALTQLNDELELEYARLDQLSIAEYEALESTDYLENLDRLGPRTEYVLLWALLYDALPRSETDPARARRLHEVLSRLAANTDLLDMPHTDSGVRIQALVLAGMTYRRLQRFSVAREFFGKALRASDRLPNDEERHRVGWATSLARIERIRNDAEDGRFADALSQLQQFRNRNEVTANFGYRMAAALLERFAYRTQAAQALHAKKMEEAKRYRQLAWKAPARLAREEPQRRDEIYAALYDDLGPDADMQTLDPFEQCALIAGLLFDADTHQDAQALFERAVFIGDQFLAEKQNGTESLTPEVLYNTGVASYRLGRLADAMERFMRITREFRTFPNRLQSAILAVQIGSEAGEDDKFKNHPEVQSLYRNALRDLVTEFSDSSSARFWRFFYAQLLEQDGHFESAVTQYALVHEDHEHHLLSIASQIRCLARIARQTSDTNPTMRLEIQQRSNECFSIHRGFVPAATSELNRVTDASRKNDIERLLAEARVDTAEVQLLPAVDRTSDALEALSTFEEQFEQQRYLLGRVWRIRLIAYEKLGKLDEAAQAIPEFVSADPQNAGPTLQALYERLVQDMGAGELFATEAPASTSANMALLLAQQIQVWAVQQANDLSAENRFAIDLQLAESNLRADRLSMARQQFQRLVPEDDVVSPTTPPRFPRVEIGLAESIYRSDEFATALPHFNRLALTLPEGNPLRWRALLRDLQCRMKLDHPADGVVKVIQQQRYLNPEMGGATTKEAFERLRREAQRRMDGE